jgi:hypothetical protein
VTSINANAFFGCKSLTSITFSSNVTSIKQYAFKGCSGLQTVYYAGTVAMWNKITIDSDNDGLAFATIYYNCSY